MENQKFDNQVVFDVLPVSKPVPIPRPSAEIQMPAIVQPIALSPLVTLQESVVLKQADSDYYNSASDYQPRAEDAAKYKSRRGRIRGMGFLVMLFALLFIAPFVLPMFNLAPGTLSFEIIPAVEADPDNKVDADYARKIKLSLSDPYTLTALIDWFSGKYYQDAAALATGEAPEDIEAPDFLQLLIGGVPVGFDGNKATLTVDEYRNLKLTYNDTDYTLDGYIAARKLVDLSSYYGAPDGTTIWGYIHMTTPTDEAIEKLSDEDAEKLSIDDLIAIGAIVETIEIVELANGGGYTITARTVGLVQSPLLFTTLALLFALVTFLTGLIALISGGGKNGKRPLFFITALLTFLSVAAVAVFSIIGLSFLGFAKPGEEADILKDLLLGSGSRILVMAALSLLLLIISIIASAVTKRKKGY
ncbi:MAG: hypothetical protein LBT55_00555 [Clostridiaceae bacterium]|jgi:hypothetical protein|nr:hypothetical protein [Clostridiaceae bacterium]